VEPTGWNPQGGTHRVEPTGWNPQSGTHRVEPIGWSLMGCSLESESYKVKSNQRALKSGTLELDTKGMDLRVEP
jgi:hypothetical protein